MAIIRTVNIKAKQREIKAQERTIDKIYCDELPDLQKDLTKIRAGVIFDGVIDEDYIESLIIEKKKELEQEQIKLETLEKELRIMKGEKVQIKPWEKDRPEQILEAFLGAV